MSRHQLTADRAPLTGQQNDSTEIWLGEPVRLLGGSGVKQRQPHPWNAHPKENYKHLRKIFKKSKSKNI